MSSPLREVTLNALITAFVGAVVWVAVVQPRKPDAVPVPIVLPSPLPPNPVPAKPDPNKPWWPWRKPSDDLAGASVGGRTSPDGKTEIACDLPNEFHRKNVSSRGQGCCVQTSLGHSARWQNVPALIDFQKWVQEKGLTGGAGPPDMDKRIPLCAKDRGYPTPEFIQHEGNDLELLKLACRTGRMPGVTYSFSPTGRYNGQRIAHMTSLVHADDNWFVILDNNYVGDQNYEWLTPEEFKKAFSPGWTCILLNGPAVPAPRN